LDDFGARRAAPELSGLQSSSLLPFMIWRGDGNDQNGQRPEHQAHNDPSAAAPTFALCHDSCGNPAANPDKEKDFHRPLRLLAAHTIAVAV
jgi:hypothetical protein